MKAKDKFIINIEKAIYPYIQEQVENKTYKIFTEFEQRLVEEYDKIVVKFTSQLTSEVIKAIRRGQND